MTEQLETMSLDLAEQVYEVLDPYYEKHLQISILRGTKRGVSIGLAQANILERNDSDFINLLKRVEFNYSIRIPDIQGVVENVIAERFKDKEIVESNFDSGSEIIFFEDEEFDLSRTNSYFPFQCDLVELIALSSLRGSIEKVHGKTVNIKPDQKIFNVSEAAEFLDLKVSYLYKLKSEGQIKAGQSKTGGSLKFRREDLLDFMFRKESLMVNELV